MVDLFLILLVVRTDIALVGVHVKALGYPTPPPADPSDALTNNNAQVRINGQARAAPTEKMSGMSS